VPGCGTGREPAAASSRLPQPVLLTRQEPRCTITHRDLARGDQGRRLDGIEARAADVTRVEEGMARPAGAHFTR
jgi:hypothetical protein